MSIFAAAKLREIRISSPALRPHGYVSSSAPEHDMSFPNGHALLISVGTYQHMPSMNIPVVTHDAEALAAVLRDRGYCGYPDAQITHLSDKTAMRANILAALEKLASLDEDATILLFYCGHGVIGNDGNYCLTTHDTRKDAERVLTETAVSDQELLARLRAIKAKRLLLIVNACHSGEISPVLGLNEQIIADTQLPEKSAAALLATGSGRVIITACREQQFSFIGSGRLTLFGQALVDGLQGKGDHIINRGGYISVFDLYSHLYDTLLGWVPARIDAAVRERYGNIQEPELTILKGVGPFAVARYRGATTSMNFNAPNEPERDIGLRVVEESRSKRILDQVLASNPLPNMTVTTQQYGDINIGANNTFGQIRDIVAGNQVQGIVNIQDSVTSVAVGVNLGCIIYGHNPDEEKRQQLVRYLTRLAAKLQRLPLSGLATQLDDGPGMSLAKVYVMLATKSRVTVTEDGLVFAGHIRPVEHFYQNEDRNKPLKEEYDSSFALPNQAIVAAEPIDYRDRHYQEVPGRRLYRALLATEATYNNARIVFLGEPGSGKSTFLRHLAWALARRGLDAIDTDTMLFGWKDTTRLLPVLLPLRKLAGRIAREGMEPATVSAALRDEMIREYDARQADDLLEQAIASGVALLLLDGLDEVPLEAVPNISADRLTTLHVVRAFVELHATTRVVITCRERAFTESLRACLGWTVETMAPFTLGQMRRFVADWYAALNERGSIARDLGEAQQQILIAAIVGNERLRAMAGIPLLLTMMALVLYERGELPRDRPLLYERILEQLLGQWDKQKGGQSLTDVLVAPNLRSDDLRPILDALCYQAHEDVVSVDGRGRLVARDLRYALTEFFEKVRVNGAFEAAGRCLAYFNERSGLLLPEDDGQTYAFAHLTLQEHGAGRHMLLQPKAVELVMRHRADDRWREPISLGLGVIQKLHPMLADRIDRVLTELIHPGPKGFPKPPERWYRDLILAAELGQERDWDLLRALISIERLQEDLRNGLVTLLNDHNQPLPTAERIRASHLLAELGDPRIPISLDEWRCELAKAQAGNTSGYFCRVEAGIYTLSIAHDDLELRDADDLRHIVKLEKPFWIARYPITNAQWQVWVAKGDGEPTDLTSDPNFNRASQPIVGVTWGNCNDFCLWLHKQLNIEVRLPMDQEWEAAAYGGAARLYPWGDDWQDDRAATKEEQDKRGSHATVPVGCYPAGAASCGAHDMAGNIWEWQADPWSPSSNRKTRTKKKDDTPKCLLRGGSFRTDRLSARCGTRESVHPDVSGDDAGFRIVVIF